MSDSGYGHDDISCMTYDIHVDILLGCVFVCAIIVCALRWGVALVGDFFYWAFLTLSWEYISSTSPVQGVDPHSGPHV